MTKKLLILLILVLVSIPAFAQHVDTVWVRRYNNEPANGIDYANAIAVDGSGNVCVTGWSLDSVTSSDYATIKYYSNGDTAWVRRYDGPGSGDDEANAIAVDGSGNVYVTGGSNDYYGTIKYDSNGDTVWVRRYGLYAGNCAYAIAVDGFGNVYVTGHVMYLDMCSYGTIKYYPDGDTAWVRIYDDEPGDLCDVATAIAVDDSDNVYVTGTIGLLLVEDYGTIKYDANGDTGWVRIYNGPPGNGKDRAWVIVVDDSGNVYVTGESPDIGTSWDYATIKYYPNGDTAWVRRYNGPGNGEDDARGIAVDGSGNVYVTGASEGSGTSYDYATIKYNPNGDTAWVRRYNGSGNGNDMAWAIAVDDSGNVYVTGRSEGSGTGYDYATIKYDPTGDTVWVMRYNGPGNGYDSAEDIALDDSLNVYVTGQSEGDGTYDDYGTIKYVQFLCGDVNKDGVVNSADIVYLINYLFVPGSPAPDPIQAGDVNRDGVVDSADVVYLINYLFVGGPPPCD